MMLQITNEGDNSFIWSPDLWIFRYVALWQCIKIFCILVGKSRQTSSIKEKTKKKQKKKPGQTFKNHIPHV